MRRELRLGAVASGEPCLESERPRLAWGEGLFRLDEAGRPTRALAVDWTETDRAWTFRLDGDARLADGSAVTANALVEAWGDARSDPCSPARWLLGPLEGFEGGADGETSLTLRLARPVPDLAERLAHPALELDGAGPLSSAPDRMPVRRIDDEPALLLSVGEADAAVLYGASATPFVEGEHAGLVAERARGWDRSYALWLNRDSPAMATPGRREAVVRAIDTEAMAHGPLGGRAIAVSSLIDPDSPPRAGAESTPRARPHATLLFDPADDIAESIAARIRADLLDAGCEVSLEPSADSWEYARRLREGAFDLALILHRDVTPDPLLRLGLTLSNLPGLAADALGAIERATGETRAPSRAVEAERVERTLIEQRRLAPLVRVEGWLVRDTRLRGLGTHAWQQLTLSRARWKR